MVELQESDSRLTLAAEMVLTLDPNFERDKTGDVGEFHNTTRIAERRFLTGLQRGYFF